MCLAIPGKVMNIDRSATPIMGDVDFSGIKRRVCLEWLPDTRVGEYVIVHVGFAISKIDEQEALETLKLFEQMGELPSELDAGPAGPDPDSE
jgi:hydrogenase expression/formation protein HypC